MPPTPQTEWCVQSGPDANCVIDGAYLSDVTTSINVTFVNQEVLATSALRFQNNGVTQSLCEQYGSTQETFTYTASSCPVENLPAACQAFTVQSCTPTSDLLQIELHSGSSNCMAICDVDDQGNNINCQEHCADYVCQDAVIYAGPGCTVPAQCAVPVTVTVTSIEDNVVSQCLDGRSGLIDGSACVSGQGCYLTNKAESYDYYYSASEERVSADLGRNYDRTHVVKTLGPLALTPTTVTQTTTFDTGTTYCVPHGTEITDGSNTAICGDSDTDSQNFGDYWCPQGFEYRLSPYASCVPRDALCAQGPVGTVSCQDITSPGTDSLYGAYDAGCVENTGTAGVPADVYDQTCCLDAIFNNFEIYSKNTDPSNIKVY